MRQDPPDLRIRPSSRPVAGGESIPARKVRLIHWNVEEGKALAERLEAAGYEVVCDATRGLAFLKDLGAHPPSAVVIDLTRLPSQGRDVGIAIRMRASTRRIPVVFVDGEAQKVALVREHLPDATYTTWPRIRAALRRAIADPPGEPHAPSSMFVPYPGRTLVQKLGIRAGETISLVNAPRGFRAQLAPLPEGARVVEQARGACAMMIAFFGSRTELGSIGSRPVATSDAHGSYGAD